MERIPGLRLPTSLAPAPATCRQLFPSLLPGWSGIPPRIRLTLFSDSRCCWFSPVRVTLPARNPKSLACPRLVTRMLAGLMSRWTIAFRVRGLQCIGNFNCESAQYIGLDGFSCNAVLQRRAVQKLRRDEELVTMLADFLAIVVPSRYER